MGVQVIELTGSPRQMGRAHGEQFRSEIHEFAERRLDACVAQAESAGWADARDRVLAFCASVLPAQERFSSAVHEEFCGIAEGADIDPPLLMICNGLTDIIDVFRSPPEGGIGCTAWLVAPDATEDGKALAGQTWDMHAWAEPFVVAFRRVPDDGPRSLTLTTTGCLSLIGLNEAGIAVGNTNLSPTDARSGVMYLAIIHQALAQSSLAAAVNTVTAADRMSGHNYYLAGPNGEIVDVETTARRSEVITPAGAFYAHANHYLMGELADLQSELPNRSTLYRLERMGQLLHERAGEITPDSMIEAMSDEDGEEDCRICRSDPSDVAATCAAAVMSPQSGEMWATRGLPSQNTVDEITL